jgi:hypothetical protein
MAGTTIAPDMVPATPRWRRVAELEDLVEIFDPGVQICSWPRELDPGIHAYLSRLHPTREVQVIEPLSASTPPKLDGLPDGPGRAALTKDLCLLREVVCELLGCPAIGLRLARIGRAMCPGWHIDRVGIRLVCTYQGPGTQWLDDQSVDRRDLREGGAANDAFIQGTAGEIVLLKGALWQDNEALGAIHRSPELRSAAALRTLVTMDPLWRE